MRSKIVTQTIALALVATLGLTGCAGFRWPWQKKATGTGTTGNTAVTDLPNTTELTNPNGERPIITSEGNLDRTVFTKPVQFAYDSASLNKASQTDVLKAVADGMKSNGKSLLIEGHADERGTAEYNRALGEKRALACRDYLVNKLGIAAGRLSTISYGKDRPADTGHGEASWAKNRRCEFPVVKQ